MSKYYSAKEIKSQSKISWHIYAFDFFFLLIYGVAAYMMRGRVSSHLKILYGIFSAIVAVGLTLPSPYNHCRRMFQSIFLYLRKDTNTYHPIRSDVFERIGSHESNN